MEFKMCPKCGMTKEHAAFHKDKRNRDGLKSCCRDCVGVAMKVYHKSLPDRPVSVQTKQCTRCGLEKHADLFYRHKKAFDGLRTYCRTCYAELDRLRNYGITEQQYQTMILKQDGRCACCGEIALLCVDHDHATKKVRALLCQYCNKMLGMAFDNPDILGYAIGYLLEHGEKYRNATQYSLPIVEDTGRNKKALTLLYKNEGRDISRYGDDRSELPPGQNGFAPDEAERYQDDFDRFAVTPWEISS